MGRLSGRFAAVDLPAAAGPDFARDVRQGLSSRPKSLPSVHFYDAAGSRLFDEITRAPEYYLTRAELSILQANAAAIVSGAAPAALVELGSGSSRKTRALIEALLRVQPELHYVAIDISRSAVLEAASRLLEDYPALRVTACVGDNEAGLAWVSQQGLGRKLVLHLGSSIGNFEPERGRALLRSVARRLGDGDALVLGADLRKDPRVLEAAYNDAAGATARFNLNLLRRINDELGGRFRPEDFRHLAFYDPRGHKVEMHLEATRRVSVDVRALARGFSFARGETIHTEDSRKYALEELGSLASSAGLSPARVWQDERRYFSVSRLEPR